MGYTYIMKRLKKILFNKQILQYESAIKEYPNIVSSAKSNVPDWYKKIPKWKNNEVLSQNAQINSTVKQCMPFLETLTTGYIIKLPFDIYVKNNNGAPFITWKPGDLDKHMPSWRANVSDLNIVPDGYFPLEYTWKLNCSLKVSKKYSMLITHPLNRNDLPFKTISGIIDGNFAVAHNGGVPFYIKNNFEGIIPQGTPIAQIIPFYNQSWLLQRKNGLVKESEKNVFKSNSIFSGFYKKNFWQRKDYN